MNILKAILQDFLNYFYPNTKLKAGRLVAAILLLVVVIVFVTSRQSDPAVEPTADKGVTVRQVSDLNGGSNLSLIGTVRAVSQATVQAEVGGLVTSVPVALGQSVRAGSVIATLENASEYAALLQAEGAYEAALANASQTGFSVETSSETLANNITSANNTYRSAFATTESVMQSTLSSIFTGANQTLLKLSSYHWEFKLIEYDLEDWQAVTLGTQSEAEIVASITEAEALIGRVNVLVDVAFANVLEEENGANATTLATLSTLKTNLTSARSSLVTTLNSLKTARLNVTDARAALERSQESSLGGEISAADAQVKQALGSLRAAQANYNKTILRSPVNGEVQNLNISNGDYISANTLVALVAGQNALEITTYISQNELDRLAVGTEVEISNGESGIVTAIAPAVDAATGKIEVRISTNSENIINGDTVRIGINGSYQSENDNRPIVVPVTALKVETDRTVAFTLNDMNELVAHPVETGSLLGSDIIITTGLTKDMSIVVDARGLNEGDKVSQLNG